MVNKLWRLITVNNYKSICDFVGKVNPMDGRTIKSQKSSDSGELPVSSCPGALNPERTQMPHVHCEKWFMVFITTTTVVQLRKVLQQQSWSRGSVETMRFPSFQCVLSSCHIYCISKNVNNSIKRYFLLVLPRAI